jgi:uncharacterized protein YjbI with pentapeptide repeats
MDKISSTDGSKASTAIDKASETAPAKSQKKAAPARPLEPPKGAESKAKPEAKPAAKYTPKEEKPPGFAYSVLSVNDKFQKGLEAVKESQQNATNTQLANFKQHQENSKQSPEIRRPLKIAAEGLAGLVDGVTNVGVGVLQGMGNVVKMPVELAAQKKTEERDKSDSQAPGFFSAINEKPKEAPQTGVQDLQKAAASTLKPLKEAHDRDNLPRYLTGKLTEAGLYFLAARGAVKSASGKLNLKGRLKTPDATADPKKLGVNTQQTSASRGVKDSGTSASVSNSSGGNNVNGQVKPDTPNNSLGGASNGKPPSPPAGGARKGMSPDPDEGPRRDFKNSDLTNQNLSSESLKGRDLSGTTLRETMLPENMSHVNLTGATIQDTSFAGKKLEGSQLQNVTLLPDKLDFGSNPPQKFLAQSFLEQAARQGVATPALKTSEGPGSMGSLVLNRPKLNDWQAPGSTLSGAHMKYAELNNAKLTNSKINRIHLERSKLTQADLSGTQGQEIEMDEANLSGVNAQKVSWTNSGLSKTTIHGADFQKANLNGTYIHESSIKDTDFRAANLTGTNFDDAEISRTRFDGTTLNGTSFRGTKFGERVSAKQATWQEPKEVDFSKKYKGNDSLAILYPPKVRENLDTLINNKVKVSKANIVNADLREMNMPVGANMNLTQMTGGSMADANLAGTRWNQAKLYGVDVSGTNLERAELIKAKLAGAKFSPETNLKEAKMPGADLSRTDLRGVNLTNANLKKANLRGAQVSSDTKLKGADVRGADLTGTYIPPERRHQMISNENTIWGDNKWQDIRQLGTGEQRKKDNAVIHMFNLRGINSSGVPDATQTVNANLLHELVSPPQKSRKQLRKESKIKWSRLPEKDVSIQPKVFADANWKTIAENASNLEGAMIQGDLSNTRLSGLNLRDVTFTRGVNLKGAALNEAKLSGADFSGAILDKPRLRRADLRGANLFGANLESGNLSEANLQRADLRDALQLSTILDRSIMTEAKLSGSNISGIDFSNTTSMFRADLQNVNAKGADFSRVKLRQANFSGANLEVAYFNRADLRGAIFEKAKFGPQTYFGNANVKGANFESTDLKDVILENVLADKTTQWGKNIRLRSVYDLIERMQGRQPSYMGYIKHLANLPIF